MVYLRITPLGLAGGSQDTTTLLADDGTALMPAGGPGTEQGEDEVSLEAEGARPLGKNDVMGERGVSVRENFPEEVSLSYGSGWGCPAQQTGERRQSFQACDEVSELRHWEWPGWN